MSSSSSSFIHTVSQELQAILSSLIGGARYGVKIRLPHALIMVFLFRQDLPLKKKLSTIKRVVLEHATNLAAFATLYKTILALLKYTSRHIKMHPSSTTAGQRESLWRMLGRTILSLIVDHPFPGEETLLHSAGSQAPPPGHPEQAHHALLAGAVGGYLVWGRNYHSSVNYQLLLYLTSRVLVGLWKRHFEHHQNENNNNSNNNAMTQQQQGQNTAPSLASQRLYRCMSAVIWGIVMVLFEESPHVLQSSLRSSMDEIYRYDNKRRSSSSFRGDTRGDDSSGSSDGNANAYAAADRQHSSSSS